MQKAHRRSEEPKVFDFSDYRSFLKARFLAAKVKTPGVSLESTAKKIGVSKSYIRYVFEKKRHITLDLVPKVAKAFKLLRQEHQALIYMVCRDTCQDAESKQFFRSILTGLSDPGFEGSLREAIAEEKSPAVFQNSLSMIIHSLSKQPGFMNDFRWIRSRLKDSGVGDEEIKSSLKFLIETKSIVQDENGKWKPAAFVFNKPVPDVLNGYQIYKIGLRLMEKVADTPEQFRPLNFQMMSLSFDEKNVNQVQELIRECRDKLIAASQATTVPSRVVMVSLNTACVAMSPVQI